MICKKCGTNLNGDENFCRICGTPTKELEIDKKEDVNLDSKSGVELTGPIDVTKITIEPEEENKSPQEEIDKKDLLEEKQEESVDVNKIVVGDSNVSLKEEDASFKKEDVESTKELLLNDDKKEENKEILTPSESIASLAKDIAKEDENENIKEKESNEANKEDYIVMPNLESIPTEGNEVKAVEDIKDDESSKVEIINEIETKEEKADDKNNEDSLTPEKTDLDTPLTNENANSDEDVKQEQTGALNSFLNEYNTMPNLEEELKEEKVEKMVVIKPESAIEKTEVINNNEVNNPNIDSHEEPKPKKSKLSIFLFIILLLAIAGLIYLFNELNTYKSKNDKLIKETSELKKELNNDNKEEIVPEKEDKKIVFNGYEFNVDNYDNYQVEDGALVLNKDIYTIRTYIGIAQNYDTIKKQKAIYKNILEKGNDYQVTNYGTKVIAEKEYLFYEIKNKTNAYLIAYTNINDVDSIGFIISTTDNKIDYESLKITNVLLTEVKKVSNFTKMTINLYK